MNVYRVRRGPPAVDTFVAALTFNDALLSADDVLGVEFLGQLSFADNLKAIIGGRQVTIEEAKASILEDGLVSFEDGRKYLVLTRHLKKRGMTFEQYRIKWGLPPTYPSVHPLVTIRLAERAKRQGLGKHDRAKSGED